MEGVGKDVVLRRLTLLDIFLPVSSGGLWIGGARLVGIHVPMGSLLLVQSARREPVLVSRSSPGVRVLLRIPVMVLRMRGVVSPGRCKVRCEWLCIHIETL